MKYFFAITVVLGMCAGNVAAATGKISIFPEQRKQVISGLGFEIQSDSIGSGNQGLPEDRHSVPHDLVPSERERLAKEMLAGFRYCRLAGGLYWRGLDPEQKYLRPRWPEQLEEIHSMMETAGVEGLSFEYWSPAPFWKANGRYMAKAGKGEYNTLRCFGPDFDDDPIYKGDVDRFLEDFSGAIVADIKTLEDAGMKISMWGLQNEPFAGGGGYSKCPYFNADEYVKAYKATAGAVRKHDPSVMLISDTEGAFPKKIAEGMNDPEVAALVDAYVVHTIGSPSENVRAVHRKIRNKLPHRPWFQNEYEYLRGGATRERCLNTVQHIMNSFQLGENPTWFWLHALKPYKNAEASGYSLGFWKSRSAKESSSSLDTFTRWRDGPGIKELPKGFAGMEMVLPNRGDKKKPGAGYNFTVNQAVTLYMLVQDCGGYKPSGWVATDKTVEWDGGTDRVYRKKVKKGQVNIHAHKGKDNAGYYGAPNAIFIEPTDPETFKAAIGINVPITIRSEALQLDKVAADVKPGHWFYNPYNWNAVGSFVKRMPWDSVALDIKENDYNKDARVFAFMKPNGKMTVVLSNRTGKEFKFDINSGLKRAKWKGFRYTPDEAGEGTMGVPVGTKSGAGFQVELPHLSWEFWEEV